MEEEGDQAENERGGLFDPNNLPFTKREKEEVKECLKAETKANSCLNCRHKCGEAMKKGKVTE